MSISNQFEVVTLGNHMNAFLKGIILEDYVHMIIIAIHAMSIVA